MATAIVEEYNKGDTISLLKKISEAVDNPNYRIEVKRIAQLFNFNLIEFYGYSTIQSICQSTTDVTDDTRTLQAPSFAYLTKPSRKNSCILKSSI